MYINKDEIMFLNNVLMEKNISDKIETINLDSQSDKCRLIKFKVNSSELEKRKFVVSINLDEQNVEIRFLNYGGEGEGITIKNCEFTHTDPTGDKKEYIRNYIVGLNKNFNCRVQIDDLKNDVRFIIKIYYDNIKQLEDLLKHILINMF